MSTEPLRLRASCLGDPPQPSVYKQSRSRWSPAGWWGLPDSDYTCTCNRSLPPSRALHTNPCPLALLFVLFCTDLKWIPHGSLQQDRQQLGPVRTMAVPTCRSGVRLSSAALSVLQKLGPQSCGALPMDQWLAGPQVRLAIQVL